MIRVAINGFGTIGRRAAEAVLRQDDMELIGVTKTRPNYEALALVRRNMYAERKIGLYAVADKTPFEEAGIRVEGTLEDLLAKADIVIDCSPELGKQNKEIYNRFRIKQLYQGGEDADIAPVSFVAQCNYEEAWGADIVRNVSCNTTGASRVINEFVKNYHVIEVMMNFARRTVDPKDSKKGPVNAYKAPEIGSHHADDVLTVLHGLNISSDATKAPVTEMHVHVIKVDIEEIVSAEDVLKLLSKEPRIQMVRKKDGYESTAQIREDGRIANYWNGSDIYENSVWKECVKAERRVRVYHGVPQEFTRVNIGQAIHQEADVVPEIIDAVRAMFCLMPKEMSMLKTNRSLCIPK